MKDLEKFEDVTIKKDQRHLSLYLGDRIIKGQTNLIVENDTSGVTTITVSFKVPNDNIKITEVVRPK